VIYLYGYLAVGVVTLLVMYVSHQVTKPTGYDEFDNFKLSLDPRSERWWWWPLNKVVAPLLVAVFAVVVWPLPVYWKVQELLAPRKQSSRQVAPEFSVTPKDLQRSWTIEEIELAETIRDPLGAVPDLPFGFLNPMWQKFREKVLPGDEMWSFAADHSNEKVVIDRRVGYTLVRNGKPADYMTVSQIAFDEVWKGDEAEGR
jgi:hypothetical protein